MLTALALDHFSRSEVDVAVIETGLGGRLDATNVLDPCLTVTTDISRDHIEILGSTIQAIAREKAGIIRRSVPHLIGLLPAEAVRVMRDTCKKRGTVLYRLRRSDFQFDTEQFRLNFRGETLSLADVSPSLIGRHQLQNCALVLKAVDALDRQGFRFKKSSIRRGLASTVWPGRFQIIERIGLPTLVLDVCHNAAGTAAFTDTFRRKFPGRKASVILGLVKRKEHQLIVDSLSNIAADISLVPLRTKRRADLDELALRLDWPRVPVRQFRSLKTAYSSLLRSANSDDIVIVVGSHYLVGEFLQNHV